MKWDEAERIVELFAQMDFMAPPTSGLIPIGKVQIEKGIREILEPRICCNNYKKTQNIPWRSFICN